MNNDEIILTVKKCFSLKRSIRPKKAIFVAQAVLLDAEKKIHLDMMSADKNHLGNIRSDILKMSTIRLIDKRKVKNAADIIKQMDVDMY